MVKHTKRLMNTLDMTHPTLGMYGTQDKCLTFTFCYDDENNYLSTGVSLNQHTDSYILTLSIGKYLI